MLAREFPRVIAFEETWSPETNLGRDGRGEGRDADTG